MSIKKISKEQPSDFKFDNKNLETAQKIIKNYPEGKQQSAVMTLLGPSTCRSFACKHQR